MVLPMCPLDYTLNKKTCRCNKTKVKKPKLKSKPKTKVKTKAVTKKKYPVTAKPVTAKPVTVKSVAVRKRCPKGTRKNKKTGLCEAIGDKIKNPFIENEPVIVKSVAVRKRCPKGTRKNKKTGFCEAVGNKIKNPFIENEPAKLVKKKSSILIPQSPNNIVSNAFISINQSSLNNLLNNLDKKTEKTKDKLISTIRGELIRNKSFSPAINRQLVSLHPGQHETFFGCGLSLKNIEDSAKLMVKIGTKKVQGKEVPLCVSTESNKAIDFFLKNLKRLHTIDCNNVIAPIQKKSNCWFNTMFMCFFISDKGRKFFRFFRQLMIQGRLASTGKEKGKLISPPKLRKAFFLLNACIEASYNADGDENNKNVLLMDTNNVIKLIYNSLPSYMKNKIWIANINEAGNPYHYYENIISYLGANSIYSENNFNIYQIMHMFKTGIKNENILINDKLNLNSIFSVDTQTLKFTRIPDICVFSLRDDNSFISKPLKFTITTGKESITYVLDSAVVRNTKKEHFCCTLTCNKKEKAFDGASIGRLRDFNWKSLISRDENWSFTYGGAFDHYSDMKWNFMTCYQILFYYRIN